MQTIKKTQINAVIYEDATHNATLTGNLCLILIQYIVTNSNGRKGNYTKTWYHRLMQKYVILHNMSCSYTLHLNMETYLFILYFIGPLHHISETVLVFSLQITQSCLSLFKYLFSFFLLLIAQITFLCPWNSPKFSQTTDAEIQLWWPLTTLGLSWKYFNRNHNIFLKFTK